MNIAFYQIDFGSLMRIWMVEQEATTRLKQVACHFYVVMGKIEQKLFEALQCVRSRIHPKFCKFTDKANNFHFGLDVNLILGVQTLM